MIKFKINNKEVVGSFADYMVKNIVEFNKRSEQENIRNYFKFLKFY